MHVSCQVDVLTESSKRCSGKGQRFFVCKKINSHFFQQVNVVLVEGELEKSRQINYHSARLPVCVIRPIVSGYPQTRSYAALVDFARQLTACVHISF